jgi:CheY-like chemotaxis protein
MSDSAPGQGPLLAGLRVLLLEDEFLIALDAQDVLSDLGAATVEVVSTLEAARERVQRDEVDIALLDINVNGEMSYDVAERCAERGVRVIFASGYELREPRMLAGAAVPCLSKPYTRESLKTALMQVLSAPGPD